MPRLIDPVSARAERETGSTWSHTHNYPSNDLIAAWKALLGLERQGARACNDHSEYDKPDLGG